MLPGFGMLVNADAAPFSVSGTFDDADGTAHTHEGWAYGEHTTPGGIGTTATVAATSSEITYYIANATGLTITLTVAGSAGATGNTYLSLRYWTDDDLTPVVLDESTGSFSGNLSGSFSAPFATGVTLRVGMQDNSSVGAWSIVGDYA